MKYVLYLDFTAKPDHEHLISLFSQAYKLNNFVNENDFDWNYLNLKF